jgi:hypothetical protein
LDDVQESSDVPPEETVEGFAWKLTDGAGSATVICVEAAAAEDPTDIMTFGL